MVIVHGEKFLHTIKFFINIVDFLSWDVCEIFIEKWFTWLYASISFHFSCGIFGHYKHVHDFHKVFDVDTFQIITTKLAEPK